ncbi:MAG TPA: superoxide dismutase [Gemmatimonadaceae bacterium]|jgi:Fe-Mn family superoxide dismutase|nr:superoxide dismutase [Gemmatimonadaceae bacterium]HXF25434.1 superoxide dismutase [Gemmatimonadaceae bacterium]
MAFTLPALPYDFAALEPSIDARTMEIHHDKHHAGYVNNLNAALEKAPELQSRSLDDLLQHLDSIPESIRTAVRNNAGGHWNHSMFWEIMSPKGGGEPTGKLADAIKKSFGDFATFQTQFADAAAKRFGSGWAWLVKDGSKLTITSTPNQDTPVMEKKHPILGVDVWEHAYYLKYQNKRGDYVSAWWNVVNWPEVGRRFEA